MIVSAKGKSVLKPEFKTKLNNGTEVIVRTIDACDKECISNEFNHLSKHSRYLRFCAPINKLSDTQLDYLTDVDNKNHVLISITKTVKGVQSGLGLGRYIKLLPNKEIAEFAITVADNYQNQGVGSLLIELLIQHAKNNDITILRGYVLESNKPMQRLLKRNNFKHTGIEDDLPRYELTI
ncbi:MAG: GNAT family N-acetyltransferase [Candidatus Thiodiazotropha sp. (ex Monitilora ramsayi)]|nr:GNAT family N-acetyltransferase [Candidatus Thiodiazotropha sp. (ex Monitilora ramsayi)]